MKRITVGFLALLVLSSTQQPATANKSRTVLFSNASVTVVQDGAWVEWIFPDALAASVQHIYRGVRQTGDRCLFKYSQSVAPAPAGWVNKEREVASSVSDCLLVTESGFAAAEEPVPTDSVSEATQVFQPTVRGGGGGGGGISIAATATRWYKVSLEDVLQLNVADDKASVSFSYNGNCVTDSWDHIGQWHWLSGTGWVNSSRGGSGNRICSYAETDTYSHFYNDPFCDLLADQPMPRTFAHFYMVRVRGQENGGQTNASDISKSGGCANVLHWDFESS